MSKRIGVEIGGTFTDLVMLASDGAVSTVKVPSTPARPEEGAMSALRQAVPSLETVDLIVHGSTIATNAVLERKGARVGLLVTKGFGDLLELQRQDRTEVYRLKYSKPLPLVPRTDVKEISERVLADGTVLQVPDPTEVETLVGGMLAAGIASVAVCLLHAYRYPEHEVTVGEFLRSRWPQLPVTLSHEITPEYREYERASTTLMSSYVQPVISRYLTMLEASLAEASFGGRLHIMQSNGGTLPADLIRRHAVRTLLSGPAGGVTAAASVARDLGFPDIITFDMGGTSTDVCLIREGSAEATSESEVDHLPIRVPMFDIVTVGAGGGSLARVDTGGMLRVGPESAGADPGPAAYGRGGSDPTVTDANVVLGLIRPDHFLGGDMQLDVAAAVAACERLGRQLGTDAVGAARAIVRVANAGMLGALRLVSTERGVNPRGYRLLCYGGAGAQHAATLAQDLGLRGVVVPRHPGLFSAYGLLIADLQRDWSAPFAASLADVDPSALHRTVAELEAAAQAEFAHANLQAGSARHEVTLAMRYPGQAFELDIGVSGEELQSVDAIRGRFHEGHRQRYGHAADDEWPEIVTIRLRAVIPQGGQAALFVAAGSLAVGEIVEIDVEGRRIGVPFFQRDELAAEQVVEGPAVVEERASTVWIPPGWSGRLDRFGHLHLEPMP